MPSEQRLSLWRQGLSTTLTNAGTISGAGVLDKVDSGAMILSGTDTLGTNTIDGGSLIVTGSLSNTSGAINVGYTGNNSSLVITNGGQVSEANLYDGVGGASNSILITGTNSSVNMNGGVLYVGTFGNGSDSLVITNGASVTNSVFSIIGNGATSSNNFAIVTGTNSLWSNSSGTFVGLQGSSNSLIITNGGVVSSAAATILGDSNTAINNSVLVTGAGSLLSNGTGYLLIGEYGSGTVTVASSGTVQAQSIAIAQYAGSTGTLNVGSLGGIDSAGVLQIATNGITFGSGTGTINFNQTNSFTLSAPIAGTGSVNQLGSGTTILSGSNSYSGNTVINAGTLQAGSSNSLSPNTAIIISNNAVLDLNNFSNSVLTLSGSGSVTLGTAALTINGGTSTSNTYSGVISGAGSIIKNGGSNTLVLTGTNTFTGTTTVNSGSLTLSTNGVLSGTTNVVINGGTLLLGSGNSINTNAAITLGGGTLSMGAGTTRASSQSFGTLTLTANSVIDYSSLAGASSLTFANIVGLSGSSQLDIYDYSPGTTQLFETSANLTSSQLTDISFYIGFGTGFLGNARLSGTQIIPVPEPSVVISALLLLGCFGFSFFPPKKRPSITLNT